MSSVTKHQIIVFIPGPTWLKLRELTSECKASEDEVVKQAIDAYYENLKGDAEPELLNASPRTQEG